MTDAADRTPTEHLQALLESLALTAGAWDTQADVVEAKKDGLLPNRAGQAQAELVNVSAALMRSCAAELRDTIADYSAAAVRAPQETPKGDFICANCGAIARGETDSLDTGTVLSCADCGGKTVVQLHRAADYGMSVRAPVPQPSDDGSKDSRDLYRARYDEAMARGLVHEAAHEIGLFAVYLRGKSERGQFVGVPAPATDREPPEYHCPQCRGPMFRSVGGLFCPVHGVAIPARRAPAPQESEELAESYLRSLKWPNGTDELDWETVQMTVENHIRHFAHVWLRGAPAGEGPQEDEHRTAQRLFKFVQDLAIDSHPDNWEPYDSFGDLVEADMSNSGDVRDAGAAIARWEIGKRARGLLREVAVTFSGAGVGRPTAPKETK